MKDLIVSFGETQRETQRQARDKWVDADVLPYLQRLLDEAQERINKGIQFFSGNGTYGFDFFEEGSRYSIVPFNHRFTEALSQPIEALNPIGLRYRARFPGLVEFVDIVMVLEDELDYVIGVVTPTNFKGKWR